MTTAWFEAAGSGPGVVLVHAGVVDSRMWDAQWEPLAARHRVVRLDLPGFGNTRPQRDGTRLADVVVDVLDAAGLTRATLVGVSLGGTASVEVAVAYPERVSALVLVGSGLPGHDWSEEVRAFAAAAEEAIARGDLEAAVEANLRTWLAGPRRSLEDVDPNVRRRVAEMQRRSFELQRTVPESPPGRLEPPVSERLGEIRAPTLVVTGDEDVRDIHAIAERLSSGIRGARRATISGAAQLPPMERPAEFNRLVLDFLAEHGL